MYGLRHENGANKTISVNTDCCVGCEECLYVCPTDAIYMSEYKTPFQSPAKAVINPNVCSLCGACVVECPVNAIIIE